MKIIGHFLRSGFLFGLIAVLLQFGWPIPGAVQLLPSAYAGNYSCENPPMDEPDNDGDECTPYTPNPAKNGGGCGSSTDTNAPPLSCGNPINFGIGNKFQAEQDYRGGGPFPLDLSRYYGSQDNGAFAFGANWHGAYSRAITTPSAAVAKVMRDDGRVLTFTSSGGVWTPDADVNARLVRTAGGWIYTTGRNETETYNAGGRLIAFSNRAGLTQTLDYDADGNLATVTGPFGRRIRFSYTADANDTGWRVSQATVPDGGTYAYTYDGNDNLVSVRYPDNSVRQYVYENTAFPHALTGVIDANGQRFATYAYSGPQF